MTSDKVEEKVKEFEVNHGQYTSHESREDAKVWLRTTLHQDRAALHTSLVAAVEGKKKTLIHSEITLPADHEDVPEELLKRATPHIYNQALDDTLTIINSIFKE